MAGADDDAAFAIFNMYSRSLIPVCSSITCRDIPHD
jgi:hypothetical protein